MNKMGKDILSDPPAGSSKCVDLTYLNKRTKANLALIMEMITLYLEQIPHLIMTMKKSLHDKDWDTLSSAVHKLIPSFSIMGIHKDFEDMAKNFRSMQAPGKILEIYKN
jgi:hypothetical protein